METLHAGCQLADSGEKLRVNISTSVETLNHYGPFSTQRATRSSQTNVQPELVDTEQSRVSRPKVRLKPA